VCRGTSSTWTDPQRTLPSGVHAQLNDPADFQPMGRFTVEDQTQPKPGLRARVKDKINKLIPGILNNNLNSKNVTSDLSAEGVSEYIYILMSTEEIGNLIIMKKVNDKNNFFKALE
jgi:hypothetical protein